MHLGDGVAAEPLQATLVLKPGDRELRKLFANVTKMAKMLDRAFPEGSEEAMAVYRAMPPAQQRRLGHLTPKELFRLHKAGKLRTETVSVLLRSRPRARRPRLARTAARTVGARGDPDSEPPPRDLDRLPGFLAASRRLYAHMRRRAAVESTA